jgi:hypothetical protein
MHKVAYLSWSSITIEREPDGLSEIQSRGHPAPKDKVREVLHVVIPHTVAYPRTMMVELRHTFPALSAMMRPLRLPLFAYSAEIIVCGRFNHWDLGQLSRRSHIVRPIDQDGKFKEEQSDHPSLSCLQVINHNSWEKRNRKENEERDEDENCDFES